MFKEATNKFTVQFSIINKTTGEAKEPDKALSAIAIKKDYAQNVYPLYVLTLSLTETDRQYIVKNDVYFQVRVYKYDIDQDINKSAEQQTQAPTITGTVLDEKLQPFDKAKIVVSANSADDVDQESQKENVEGQKVSYSVACIPLEQLAYNDSIINACYSEANVNEIIINILSQEYKGSVYYQESKNVTRYDSSFIPPMSLIPALRYLNQAYAVYQNNVTPFFDIGRFYMYDIQEDQREFENNLFINVVKSEDTAVKSQYQVPQMDENGDVQLILPNDPDVQSGYDVFRNQTGGLSVFSSYDSQFNLVSRDYSLDKSVKKTRYFWNPRQRKEFEERSVKQFYQSVSIGLPNFDCSKVNPATKIMVSGGSLPEINGQYALIGEVVTFSTTDFSNYNGSVICQLAKY